MMQSQYYGGNYGYGKDDGSEFEWQQVFGEQVVGQLGDVGGVGGQCGGVVGWEWIDCFVFYFDQYQYLYQYGYCDYQFDWQVMYLVFMQVGGVDVQYYYYEQE